MVSTYFTNRNLNERIDLNAEHLKENINSKSEHLKENINKVEKKVDEFIQEQKTNQENNNNKR